MCFLDPFQRADPDRVPVTAESTLLGVTLTSHTDYRDAEVAWFPSEGEATFVKIKKKKIKCISIPNQNMVVIKSRCR